jgi:ribosomal protein S12 methylthiotransferase
MSMMKTSIPTPKNRVYVISLGCPKNLVDTEIMVGDLVAAGWEVTGAPEDADLFLVNTCAFIASAAQEAVDTVLEMGRLKAAHPARRLVAAGCLVQRYGEELAGLLPEVDLFVGVNDFPRLRELLDTPALPSPVHCRGPRFDYAAPQARFAATPRHLAYLKIAEGCSHRCTYCTIPAIRGPLRSRSLDTLITEARALAAQGVRELNLVAQDTTAYGADWGGRPGLAELLTELAQIPGLVWIRILYAHPARLTPEILAVMAAHANIVPYLDLPIQHAHDEVLRRMGRGHGRRHLIELFKEIRRYLPQAWLRTTIMAGFPGETEAQFESLCEFVQETGFHHLGVFIYEPEEGTPAARLPGPVPRRTAKTRARRLKALQTRLVKARLKTLVGTVQDVLVEGVSQESDYLLVGRLAGQAPEIDSRVYLTAGAGLVGEIQPVRLTRVLGCDLAGEILGEKEEGN